MSQQIQGKDSRFIFLHKVGGCRRPLWHLPEWRRRKLTFNLPDGFHFEVRHREGRRFHVRDQTGESQRFTEYTNIDPHGFVRSGR